VKLEKNDFSKGYLLLGHGTFRSAILLLFQNTEHKGVPYSTKHGFLASREEYKLHVLGGKNTSVKRTALVQLT
jgi:hypothetical protein